MVKFICYTSVAQCLQVWILGVDLTLLIKPCCGGIPHTKWRKTDTYISSGLIFLKPKKEKKKKKRRIGNGC